MLKGNDPIEFAKSKGIIVIEEPLGNVFGYYNRVRRTKMIHINKDLDKAFKRFTCAHELGHALLHPDEITPQLTKLTISSNYKIEMEANRFAVNFIIDNSHKEFDINNKYQLLDYYGIPYEMDRFINLKL